ncbi:hypothetical protein KGMB03357_10860 [Anaerotignum faecicola]|uniref:Uncharacterized protein n=1 Tax=Anaerotignum faecicola TaxID=2358141 RepID=A0A401LDH5_9FIRM|nr:hypothetical protein KGMB03357_10860 [Anaerotignum faecicola]
MRHKRHDIEKFTKEGLTNYKRKSKKRLQKKKFTKEEILQKKKKHKREKFLNLQKTKRSRFFTKEELKKEMQNGRIEGQGGNLHENKKSRYYRSGACRRARCIQLSGAGHCG